MIEAGSCPARGISGHAGWDGSAAEAAVDFEVRVGGEKERVGEDFIEADQAGVGDAHWNIGVFFEEIEDSGF